MYARPDTVSRCLHTGLTPREPAKPLPSLRLPSKARRVRNPAEGRVTKGATAGTTTTVADLRREGWRRRISRDSERLRRRALPTGRRTARPRKSGAQGLEAFLERAIARRLRVRLRAAVQSEQCSCTGERRSTTSWQRRHSSNATFILARAHRAGSGISLAVSPRERNKWPAPARCGESYEQAVDRVDRGHWAAPSRTQLCHGRSVVG